MDEIKVAFYLHCKKCVENVLPESIESFVDSEGKVWIWCKTHDLPIYETPHPVMDVEAMRCAGCAKHTH